MSDEIKRDIQIDPDALDVAWLEQADLFYKYSEQLNRAMSTKNELKLILEIKKEEVDKVKARLDLDIRKNPEAYDLTKISEAAVSSAILVCSDYVEVQSEMNDLKQEFNEAQDEVNQLYSCVHAMEQRKVALENLVRLLNQQYFSTPESPRNLSFEYRNKTQITKEGAKRKIKNRRKRNE